MILNRLATAITFFYVFALSNCLHGMSQKEQLNHDLLVSAQLGNIERIKEYIVEGADVNDMQFGSTALMFAAERGRFEACQLLIANGANANTIDLQGSSALTLAAASPYFFGPKKYEICTLLIRAMIQPSKEQVRTVVALLGLSKKGQTKELYLAGKDVVKLIGKEKLEAFKQENKPEVRKQIMKIYDTTLRNQLLDYLNKL